MNPQHRGKDGHAMLPISTPDKANTQDLQTPIPGFFAEEDDAPKKAGDAFEIGLGLFLRTDKGGYAQSARHLRASVQTLETLAAWIEEEKGSHRYGGYGPCRPLRTAREAYYSGIPRSQPEGCTAAAFVGGESLILDVDGLPLDLRPRLEEYLQAKGGYLLHTSKSHNPRTGKANLKIIVPCNRRMRPRELRKIGERFTQDLAAHLGVSAGAGKPHVLDINAARPEQPETLPYFEREDLEGFFEIRVHDADPLDVSTMLEEARLELEAEDILEAEIKERLASGEIDVSDIDRVGEARREIERRWLCSPGEGISNRFVFMGAVVCVGWALTEEEAEGLLLEIYGGAGHEPAYVSAKIRGAYRDPRGLGSRLRRAAAAAVEGADLEDLVYAHTGAETPPPYSDSNSAFCERTRIESIEKERSHTPPSAPGGEAASRYLPAHTRAALEAARVHLIRAPTGAGKTTALAPAVRDLLDEGERVIACSHRVTLCQDIGHGLGLPSYQDSQGSLTASAVVCLPSISRVDPWGAEACEEGPTPMVEPKPPIAAFIGDEIEQIIRSLFSSICKDGRAGIYSSLKSRMLCAGTVVLQDADLGPLTLALVREVFGDSLKRSDIRVIDLKTSPGIKVVITESRPHHLMRITRGLEDRTRGCGPGLWEFSTSQEEVISRAKWARETYPDLRILDLHSDTIEDYRHILEDKNLLASYDYVICSPTLGSGYNFDSQKLATDAEFAVFGTCRSFCGSLAQDCKQGLSRVRHPHGNVWHVLVEGAGQDEDTHHRSADDFYQDLLKVSAESERLFAEIGSGWRQTLDISGVPVRHPVDDELCRLWSHVQAHKDRWSRLKGPAGALREHFEACRYGVEYRTREDEDAETSTPGRRSRRPTGKRRRGPRSWRRGRFSARRSWTRRRPRSSTASNSEKARRGPCGVTESRITPDSTTTRSPSSMCAGGAARGARGRSVGPHSRT
ncbi:MAG: hypothetical protein R3A79_07915 [Nannocystaceae bacterium]